MICDTNTKNATVSKKKSRFHETKIFRHSSFIDFEHKVYCVWCSLRLFILIGQLILSSLFKRYNIRPYYGRGMAWHLDRLCKSLTQECRRPGLVGNWSEPGSRLGLAALQENQFLSLFWFTNVRERVIEWYGVLSGSRILFMRDLHSFLKSMNPSLSRSITVLAPFYDHIMGLWYLALAFFAKASSSTHTTV